MILAATGGSDKHCLIVEHQLRPLFGSLQAYTVPVGVYASHADFESGELKSPLVLFRVTTAARQAVGLAQSRSAPLTSLNPLSAPRALDSAPPAH